MARLTKKQKAFVDEYLIDLNATKAAIRAGYSEKTARSIGQENLTKPDIQSAIEDAMDELEKRTEITQDRVLQEYARLAFSNMLDFISIQGDGTAFVDLSGLDADQAAAISEIIVDEYKDGAGDDARDVKRVKIKLIDKKGALDSVARHLGMFNDTLNIKGNLGLTSILDEIDGTSTGLPSDQGEAG